MGAIMWNTMICIILCCANFASDRTSCGFIILIIHHCHSQIYSSRWSLFTGVYVWHLVEQVEVA
jgi:hypothetical protein